MRDKCNIRDYSLRSPPLNKCSHLLLRKKSLQSYLVIHVLYCSSTMKYIGKASNSVLTMLYTKFYGNAIVDCFSLSVLCILTLQSEMYLIPNIPPYAARIKIIRTQWYYKSYSKHKCIPCIFFHFYLQLYIFLFWEILRI